MSWAGDVFKFEKFGLGNMWDKVKDDPWRLLIGAGDPLSTKGWNKILGKDMEPLVDQWGGQPKDAYAKAEAAGIETGPGKTMHNIAKVIASLYAGGYGLQQAGALGGSGGGWAEAMGTGAAPGEAAGSFTGSATGGGGMPTWANYIPKQMPGGQNPNQNAAQVELERLERERQEREYKQQLAMILANVQNRGWNG